MSPVSVKGSLSQLRNTASITHKQELLVLARLDRTTQQHADVLDIYPTVSDIMADLWPQANARQQQP